MYPIITLFVLELIFLFQLAVYLTIISGTLILTWSAVRMLLHTLKLIIDESTHIRRSK